MKKVFNYSLLLALAAVVVLGSCRGGEDPDPLAERLAELAATWNMTSATAAGDNISLSGVSITATAGTNGGNYTITGLDVLNAANLNHSGVLSASGTFTMNADNLNRIVVGGNNIELITLTATTLVIEYQSNYPKIGDAPQAIRLSGTKAN
jgi:hypothetical protein